MVWRDAPKWNGKSVKLQIDKYLAVFAYGVIPFTILIEHCEDQFLPIFSEKSKLEKFMKINGKKMGVSSWAIKEINEKDMNEIREKVRIMLDPIIIDEHHTKWFEVIRDGDQWKYVDATSN